MSTYLNDAVWAIRHRLQDVAQMVDSYTIDSASADDTSITLSTVSEAALFSDGMKIIIYDDSNSETNEVSGNGNAVSGVVSVTTALTNNYTSTPKVQRIEQQLQDSEIEDLISKAVERFSRDMPYEKVKDIAGQKEHQYELPSDWEDDFSIVVGIEMSCGDQKPTAKEPKDYGTYTPDTTAYIIDSASESDTEVTTSTAAEALYFCDGDIVSIYDDSNSETNWVSSDGVSSTGVIAVKNALSNNYTSNPKIKKLKHLRMYADEPDTDEFFRLTYTLFHTLTNSTKTIPTVDYEAFLDLTSGVCAMVIASRFAHSQESSIDADAVDYAGKATLWRDHANDFFKSYEKHIGIKDGEQKPINVQAEYDTQFMWGRDFLFHRKSWR
jgi:hypothetical protein